MDLETIRERPEIIELSDTPEGLTSGADDLVDGLGVIVEPIVELTAESSKRAPGVAFGNPYAPQSRCHVKCPDNAATIVASSL